MSEQLTMEQLDELEKHFEGQIKDEEEKEQLYHQQADEIVTVLCAGKKVNDGFYTWTYSIREGKEKVKNCTIVAARNILMFNKGYTPMFCQFEVNEEVSLFDNLKEAILVMLKRQNGEYVAEVIE